MALRQVQRPWPAYLRRDLKALSQMGYLRAAEWIRLARGGYLVYILRHTLDSPPGRPAPNALKETRDKYKAWETARDRLLTLHWMCVYVDAMCSPVMDAEHQARIGRLAAIAAGHWYTYLPATMHTLLVHALLQHSQLQASHYGPQCLYWLFHKERFLATAHMLPPCCLHAASMRCACYGSPSPCSLTRSVVLCAARAPRA